MDNGPYLRDLSGWIYTGMWHTCPEYPGAEISELPPPAFLPADSPVYLQQFLIGGQTGTYIESRAHVDSAAPPVSDFPLDDFCRPAVVFPVGPKAAGEPVTLADLQRTEVELRPGDAALICTGWDAHWDQPDFVSGSPYIQGEAGAWLIAQGIGLLGGDLPCFDLPQRQFPWAEFWARVPLLLAPLANLGGLQGRCGRLLCLPLKIRGAAATPCRAALLREN